MLILRNELKIDYKVRISTHFFLSTKLNIIKCHVLQKKKTFLFLFIRKSWVTWQNYCLLVTFLIAMQNE